MRDSKGRFIKGHIVPDEWKELSSKANNGVKNIKNSLRERSSEELKLLKDRGFKKGNTPWNKNNVQVEFKCVVCGKIDKDKPYRRHKYCSNSCKNKSKGETHWRYKGNESRGIQTKRNWKIYKDFKKEVHIRDKRCLACGSRKDLIAHHLKQWKDNEDLRFDINNAITLCKDCHILLHKYCGRNKIDEKKQSEWLKNNIIN